MRSRDIPGSVTVTVSPGPMHRRDGGLAVGDVELGRAAAARSRRPPAGCAVRRRPRSASSSRRTAVASVAASAERTLPASTCWVSRTPGAVSRACAQASANTVATSDRRQHLPQRAGPAPAGLAGRGARGRVAGVEVFGQQRAQQRRHRDARGCARPRARCARRAESNPPHRAHAPGRHLPHRPSPTWIRYSTPDHRYIARPQIRKAHPAASTTRLHRRRTGRSRINGSPTSARTSPPCRCR